MSQREEAEEEGVRPTEPPLCGQPESQTGAQSPEQQRPESAGRRMDVEDNVSTESLPEIKLSNLDIVWCLPYPFDPLADEETIDDVISPLDPKGSPADYCPSSEDRMRMAEDDDDDNLVQSSNSLSRTSSGYSSASSLSFKSDWSKDNIIDFKGGSATLMSDYSPSSEEEEGAADDDVVQPSNRLPELQRPESAGRRMTVEDIWSTFWHRFLPIHSRRQDSLKKSSMCPFPDFKESSNLSPELQRPESAGLKMTVEDIWSTFWHRFLPIHSLPKSRTSSEDSFTSSLSFKSDQSKDNTIIDFKEGRSTLIPELQRPESAGRRMNEWRKRSADRLRPSRTSSRYSSKSKLYFKSDGSKDDSMVFRGRRSSLRSRTRQMSREKSKEYTLDF